MAADDDSPRQHALSRAAADGQGLKDSSKNLRLDSPEMSECIPVLGFQAPKSCSFKNAVHGRVARSTGNKSDPGLFRYYPTRFHVFRPDATSNVAGNQRGRVQVPSMPLPPPGRVDRAAKPIRAVTANPSIRSVSDLSKHRIYIEDVYPVVDVGRFPVKRIVGEELDVWADIFRDGHVVLAAELLWRREGADKWLRVPMVLHNNDRWKASFTPPKAGRYVYAIEAWTDVFASWRRDFLTKRAVGMDVELEIEEGRNLLADLKVRNSDQTRLIRDVGQKPDIVEDPAPLLSEDLAAAASKGQQSDLTRSATYPLVVDRPIARAGAWYEMMPRSQSAVFGKHGTFDDCINRLPDIAAMGFDVLYLTPIHPIGRVNRKGRNNSLRCEASDPGSPYAIGSAEGGHDAVHPELGTLDDFRRFVRACAEHRLEVALDFAVQCSPDHPWLAQHPEWFRRRPDGSIQYSENPPKKYEDIVNPDLYAPDNEGLWKALRDVVLFWIAQGVRIFRVDNPHTKAFPFWEWLIREVQSVDPDV